jgi:hypothetical protein
MNEQSTPFGAGFSDALSGKLPNKEAPDQEYANRYVRGYQSGYSRLNESLSFQNKHKDQPT